MVAALASAASAKRRLASLYPLDPASLEAPLSVIIPARNEAERIWATLEALLHEPSATLSVRVYDDDSTDDTGRIVQAFAARDPRLSWVRGPPLDVRAGFGKPHALARATADAPDASGPWLFLDADVRLDPGTLGGLMRALDAHGLDALSGAPRVEMKSRTEQLLMPVFLSLAASAVDPARVHDARRPEAFLNGQLILIRRDALARVGGWASVTDAVLEDVALARRLKRAGLKIGLADLRGLATTHMYDGWAAMRAGFQKNAVALHGGALTCATLGLSGFVLAALAPAATLWALALPGPPGAVWVAGGGWLFVTAVQAALRRWLALPGWPVLFQPIAYAAAGLVLVRAALSTWWGGTIAWRGRTYRASKK